MSRALIVVDLEDSPVRHALERRAARLVAAARRRHDVTVIATATPGTAVPASLGPTVSPGQVVPAGDVPALHRRALAEAASTVRAAEPGFPTVHGVSLAQLNVLPVQERLTRFVMLEAAVRRWIAEHGPARCDVVGTDPAAAEALRAAVAESGTPVKVWTPMFMHRVRLALGNARARLVGRSDVAWAAHAREAATAIMEAVALRPADTTVLVLSESRPMSQTFAAIEQAMPGDWEGRVVRIQLGGGRLKREDRGWATICEVPDSPGLGSAARAGLRSMPPAARTLGAAGTLVQNLRLTAAPQQFIHLHVLNAVLDSLRPALVVVGNDRWWVGRALVELARRRGIPSLLIQDGIAGAVPAWSWVTADVVGAASEGFVRYLAEHGVARERCTVIGQPRYDRLLASRGAGVQRRARRALGLPEEGRYVLVATQPIHEADWLRQVVDAIARVDGVRILLRPHPSQPPAAHEAIARESDRVRIHAKDDIVRLLEVADIVVTQYSTVMWEAALLGKQVVSVDFRGQRDVTLAWPETARCVGDSTALTEVVRELVSAGGRQDQAVPRELEDVLGPVDGGAAARAFGLMAGMLRPKHVRLAPAEVGS